MPRAALKKDHIVAVLRQLRVARDLSQERLAERSGVDRTTVGKYERKVLSPTLLKLDQLLVAMDVSWGDFGKALDIEIAAANESRGAARARRPPARRAP